MFNIPKLPLFVPWFIFDIDNKILITSPTVPGNISDRKDVVLAEQPIPGLNYAPIQSGGMGNKKIAFTLKLIKKDRIVGNVAQLKQFDNLRQPSFNMLNIFQKTSQFTPNPKVLYFWGTGTVPLVYYVKKADFDHQALWGNSFGQPTFTNISIELILDEAHPLNKLEQSFRQLTSIAGQFEGLFQVAQTGANRRPF